jgi:hypothetical protein
VEDLIAYKGEAEPGAIGLAWLSSAGTSTIPGIAYAYQPQPLVSVGAPRLCSASCRFRSDAEYDAITAAATPIHASQRSAFLQRLADELTRHPIIGEGLVFRVAAELQRKFLVEARAAAQGEAERKRAG